MGFGESAQGLFDLGFNVIPVWPNGVNGSNGKDKPVFPWHKWQDERQTQADIDTWVKDFSDCNVAVVTGQISGIIVLDFDDVEAAANFQIDYEVPPTLSVKTQKGYHLYFRVAEDNSTPIGNYVGILPKVDIRGNGGYVIAPDSTHASGFVYTWSGEHKEIESLPESVMKLIEEKRKQKVTQKQEADWVSKMWEGVGEGQRNDACAKMAGHYIAKGITITETFQILCQWNKNNKPPMPEGEIKTTVQSIFDKDSSLTPAPINTDPVPLDECKRVVSKWIYYKDDSIVDLALAVANSTPTDQEPCWVVFVGAASTGKTELLRAFKHYNDVYYMDSVTAPAFASGLKNAKGLLERVNGKRMMLIFQDLSTVFSKQGAEQSEIFDTLRQIYNGHYEREWGSGKKKVIWDGKFNFLSGSTPEIEARSMGELGERFLYYRIESNDDETRGRMKAKVKETMGNEIQARREISEAIHGVLNKYKGIDIKSVTIGEDIDTSIDYLVDAITALRSPVKRHSYHQEQVEYEPAQEGPARMMKMMRNICQSLAVIRGRDHCTEEDLVVVRKMGIDSVPSMRRRVLRSLIRRAKAGIGGNSYAKAKEISEDCGYISTYAATTRLEDLAGLGICVKKYERALPSSFGQGIVRDNAQVMFMLKPKFYETLAKAGLLAMTDEDKSLTEIEMPTIEVAV